MKNEVSNLVSPNRLNIADVERERLGVRFSFGQNHRCRPVFEPSFNQSHLIVVGLRAQNDPFEDFWGKGYGTGRQLTTKDAILFLVFPFSRLSKMSFVRYCSQR